MWERIGRELLEIDKMLEKLSLNGERLHMMMMISYINFKLFPITSYTYICILRNLSYSVIENYFSVINYVYRLCNNK